MNTYSLEAGRLEQAISSAFNTNFEKLDDYQIGAADPGKSNK